MDPLFMAARNSCVEILTPKFYDIGDEAVGWWLGGEGGVLMNAVNTLRDSRELPHSFPPCEDTAKRGTSMNQVVSLAKIQTFQHLDLRLPRLQINIWCLQPPSRWCSVTTVQLDPNPVQVQGRTMSGQRSRSGAVQPPFLTYCSIPNIAVTACQYIIVISWASSPACNIRLISQKLMLLLR